MAPQRAQSALRGRGKAESLCSRSHSGQARSSARFIPLVFSSAAASYHWGLGGGPVNGREGVPGVPPFEGWAVGAPPPAASSPTAEPVPPFGFKLMRGRALKPKGGTGSAVG